MSEADAGTTPSQFTVTLSTASAQTVTVSFVTAGNTAQSGTDFSANFGTLTFLPGETSKTVDVTILDDLIDEPDESFFLLLSNPTNATIATAQGTGTITNDD